MKYLGFLFLLFACEDSSTNNQFDSRLNELMRRKDSLVRERNAEEKKLSEMEKSKRAEVLIGDTSYTLQARNVVTLSRQISFVDNEIRQLENERREHQQGRRPR
jgi:hypothetical protein